jgi:hypothetical protein
MTTLTDRTKLPHEVLAEAIEKSGLRDSAIAQLTFGQVTELQAAELRAGLINPLPTSHSICNVLSLLDLTDADIGQPAKRCSDPCADCD